MIQLTEDGSHTMYVPSLNVTYHSRFGAMQESKHIFIDAGLSYLSGTKSSIHILEVGFGTGLNAWLTLEFAVKENISVFYCAIEKYPVTVADAKSLNFPSFTGKKLRPQFLDIHKCEWDADVEITPGFTLHKMLIDLREFETSQHFDLIYFDAFDFSAQPHLWTEQIFRKLYSCMNENSVLVTYCSKGLVRRNMESAGFVVEKLKGPRGKREMVRCKKE